MKKVILMCSLLMCLCGCNDTVKVGTLRYSHSTYTEEVYVVIKENGDEAYVLDRYVESCLQVYKNNGTYGAVVKKGKTL